MFNITKSNGVASLNISVQMDNVGTFDLVPLSPHQLPVQMNQVTVHCPGYEPAHFPNPVNNSLYVVNLRNGQLNIIRFD